MQTNDKILDLIKECENSSFSKNNYQVNIDLNHFIKSMLLHTYYDKLEIKNDECNITSKEWLERVTPEFQRKNNKWTKKMKIKFIENLLKGVKTELLLFRMKEGDDAQIIDGLQRTTAILDFLDGKIKAFGFSRKDFSNKLNSFAHHNLIIKIYTFNTWKEVGKFYIDMNENITHSKADIQKAKDWFLNKHNIKL